MVAGHWADTLGFPNLPPLTAGSQSLTPASLRFIKTLTWRNATGSGPPQEEVLPLSQEGSEQSQKKPSLDSDGGGRWKEHCISPPRSR